MSHGGRQRSSQRIPAYVFVPGAIVGGSFVYCYVACRDEAPLTKRSRIIATSPAFEREMGDRNYQQLLKQYRRDILPPDHRASVTVKRVGQRIVAAAERFADKNIPPSYEVKKGAPFTYTVVKSDQANAFVLPGNHVFVLTGLFKFATNEDELAGVLGHEVAHNLARHAGERMSSGFFLDMIARLSFLVDPTGGLYLFFIGPASALLHQLPNSREAEIEADEIGIHLAADACYDPRAAKRVFSAMKSDSGDKMPPEFISTHPSYDTRLTKFDEWMPEALAEFNADGGMKCRRVREEMQRARRHAAEMAARRDGMHYGVTRPSSSGSFVAEFEDSMSAEGDGSSRPGW